MFGVVSPYNRRDKNLVGRLVKSFAVLCDFADRGVYKLARCVMSADAEGLVVRAFSGNVCARVKLVIKWTFVCRGVTISFG